MAPPPVKAGASADTTWSQVTLCVCPEQKLSPGGGGGGLQSETGCHVTLLGVAFEEEVQVKGPEVACWEDPLKPD